MHVPQHTRSILPAIPWAQLRGLRHRLVQGYATIGPHSLDLTAAHDVRDMLRVLSSHLAASR
jgi:uncharacterized protein with HEPN domain